MPTWDVIVERLSAPSLLLHDPCASLGVGLCPIDNAVLEQLVEKIVDPVGKTTSASPGCQTANSIQYLPDGDGREPEAVIGNRVEKGRDPLLRARPHHPGNDVGIHEPGKRSGHACSSPVNDSGL